MIGSWSNRIIEKSRCHMWDRHALDTFNPDLNYLALGLVLIARRTGIDNPLARSLVDHDRTLTVA
jgi:hypothetical protein